MSNPLVTINIVVLNGQKYIGHCLDSVKGQTYNNIEVNVLDDGSTDKTKEIIRSKKNNFILRFPKFFLYENKKNLGMWGGQEKALDYSSGKYNIALSVDVILEPNAIKEAVKILESDNKIGAVEPKIYRYKLNNGKIEKTNIIDTCGYRIYKSRRMVNIGHGQLDSEEFNKEKEIFAVEGACPIFRTEAFKDCKIGNEIMDSDMFWYGDDVDQVWRMNLLGWKQIFSPKVVAYHDRQTTKRLRKSKRDFINIRKVIPAFKRRLDYRNSRLILLKNDYFINFIKDLPYFLYREIPLWGYFLIYEPFMIAEVINILKLMPKMLRKRKKIMKRAKVSPREIHKWFSA